jgi:predicted glycosyltransferase
VSREVSLPFHRLLGLRADVIDAAVRSFLPHLVLVDHAPLGMAGEVFPALCTARRQRPETRIVLGLRDIYDDPALVRASWRSQGVYAVMEEVYDRILVYGQPEVFDLVKEYALPEASASKVTYTGYIHRADTVRRNGGKRAGGAGGLPRVLVTVGGGQDGFRIVKQYLEGIHSLRGNCPWSSVVVLGPFMSGSQQEAAQRMARALGGVSIIDSTPRLRVHLSEADLVLTMGGYNTVLEALALGKPTVVVPRVSPRKEQLVRALRLADRGLIRCIDPRHSTPASLMSAVRQDLFRSPPAIAGNLDLGGIERMVKVVAEVLGSVPRRSDAKSGRNGRAQSPLGNGHEFRRRPRTTFR